MMKNISIFLAIAAFVAGVTALMYFNKPAVKPNRAIQWIVTQDKDAQCADWGTFQGNDAAACILSNKTLVWVTAGTTEPAIRSVPAAPPAASAPAEAPKAEKETK